MAKHKVEITGIKTSELKVLTNEEQMDLFNKMKNGDVFAREKLIEGNYKLVLSILIGEIRRYLRDDNMVRVSRSVKDLAYRTLKAKETFMLEHGRDATIDEISEIIGESAIDIICALEATRGTVSIFEPIYNDGGETIYLFDQIENKSESSNNWNTKIILENALNKLKTKEQFILLQRYLIGKTQMEISDELGISQAQVSRIEKNALNNVKKLIK